MDLNLTVVQSVPLVNPNGRQVKNAVILYSLLVACSLLLYSILRKVALASIAPRAAKHDRPTTYSSSRSSFWNICDVDLSWSWKALSLRESDLIRYCGYDGYLFLRVVRFLWITCAVYSFLGVFVLIPFYQNQEQDLRCLDICRGKGSKGNVFSTKTCVCTYIDSASMATTHGEALWLPVGIMVVFAILTIGACYVEYQNILRLRKRYWATRPPQSYTVLVQYVPLHLRSANGSKLKDYFDSVIPGDIISVSMVDVDSDLLQGIEQIASDRYNVLAQLERAKTLHNLGVENITKWGCEAESIQELIPEFETRLGILNEQYTEELTRYEHALATGEVSFASAGVDEKDFDDSIGPEYFSAAFVTFKTMSSAVIASQNAVEQISTGMVFKPAPQPQDLIWNNVGISFTNKMTRRSLSRIVFFIILLFWGVFTSIVGASTSTDSLAEQFPMVKHVLLAYPTMQKYLDYVAPVLLVSAVGIVNPLMSLTCRFEGRASETENDRHATERYFLFLVIQVFLFYSIAGTLFKTLVQIIQQPATIVNTLGGNIPKNAAFYIQFIIVKVFWMLCFELLRVVDVFLGLLRRFAFGKSITPRDQATYFLGWFEIHYPSPVNLSSTLSQILLVYFIAIVYSVIQPMVLPAAFVFFSFANVVYTVVLTSARKQMYDSGGRYIWNITYKGVMFGLVTAELTLLGVLLLKSGYAQVFVMWIVVTVTIYTGMRLYGTYSTLIDVLPLNLAARIDRGCATNSMEFVEPPCWQYGLLRPGQTIPQPHDDINVAYKFENPVLTEPPTAVPFEFMLDSRRKHTTRYGSVSY